MSQQGICEPDFEDRDEEQKNDAKQLTKLSQQSICEPDSEDQDEEQKNDAKQLKLSQQSICKPDSEDQDKEQKNDAKQLTKLLKEREVKLKKKGNFEESSNTDQVVKGKVLLLKKQLLASKTLADKKVKETEEVFKTYEQKISDLQAQLSEKNILKDASEVDQTKKEDFEKFSNTNPADQVVKGKVVLLKTRLMTSKILAEKREKEIEEISKKYEQRIGDLEAQLNEKTFLKDGSNVDQILQSSCKSKPEVTMELQQQIVLKQLHEESLLKLAEFNEVMDTKKQLEARNLYLTEQLKKYEEATCHYEDKIKHIGGEKDLPVTNHVLKEAMQNLQKKNDVLVEEVSALKAQKIKLEMRAAELEEAYESSEKQIREFCAKAHELVDEDVISFKQQTCSKQVDASMEKMVKLKSEQNLLISENDKLNSENRSLIKRVEESQETILQLKNNVTKLETEHATRNTESRSLNFDFSVVKENLATVFATAKVKNINQFIQEWDSQKQELNICKITFEEAKTAHCDEVKRLQTSINDIEKLHEQKINELSLESSKNESELYLELSKKENECKIINDEVERLRHQYIELNALLMQKEEQLSDQIMEISSVATLSHQGGELADDAIGKINNEGNVEEAEMFKNEIMRLRHQFKCNHELLHHMTEDLKQSKELHKNAVAECDFYKNASLADGEKYLHLAHEIKDLYKLIFSPSSSLNSNEVTLLQQIKTQHLIDRNQIVELNSKIQVLQENLQESDFLSREAASQAVFMQDRYKIHNEEKIAFIEKVHTSTCAIHNEKNRLQQDLKELKSYVESNISDVNNMFCNIYISVKKKLDEAVECTAALRIQLNKKESEFNFLQEKLQKNKQQASMLCTELQRKKNINLGYINKLRGFVGFLEVNESNIVEEKCFSEVIELLAAKLQAYHDETSSLTKEILHLKTDINSYSERIKAFEKEILDKQCLKSEVLNIAVSKVQTQSADFADRNSQLQITPSECLFTKETLNPEILIKAEETTKAFHGERKESSSAFNIQEEQQGSSKKFLEYSRESCFSDHQKRENFYSTNEYQLLIDEQEMDMKELSITHELTKPQVFQRWFRSQRNHFAMACQRKKYLKFLPVIYVFIVHIWLLSCLFGSH